MTCTVVESEDARRTGFEQSLHVQANGLYPGYITESTKQQWAMMPRTARQAMDSPTRQHHDVARELAQLKDSRACEEASWKAHVIELEQENARLEHEVYMNATNTDIIKAADPPERIEALSLRQQLACLDDRCRSLTKKADRLQEQAVAAERMLAVERAERLEERNSQLTVVVAKHSLERRMRFREQDLQTEWRKNADLAEKCRRLEEELARSKRIESKSGCEQAGDEALPSTWDNDCDDDWRDEVLEAGTAQKTMHTTPDYGHSKLVRWKKRLREGGPPWSHEAKRRRMQDATTLPYRSLALAGSESPPAVPEPSEQVFGHREVRGSEQASQGANVVDDLETAEYTESETPARAASERVATAGTEPRGRTIEDARMYL